MKTGKTFLLAQLLTSVLVAVNAFSEESDADKAGDLFDLPLEEIVNTPVTVTSRSSKPLRSAPGVVSVITRQEIENTGAIDLLEILQFFPGLSIFGDVQGTVGIGIRGHDARVLLLWNGHKKAEVGYNTTQYGMRFPADQIERVEMIRGPGSVLYGGVAAFGVINVITRDAKSLDGGFISTFGGTTNKSVSRYGVNMMAGKDYGDTSVSTGAYLADGFRGDGDYTDIIGNTIDMDEQVLRPKQFSMDINHKGLELSGLVDQYHMRIKDGYTTNIIDSAQNDFNQYSFIGRYKAKPATDLEVAPFISYLRDEPFRNDHTSPSEDYVAFHHRSETVETGIVSNYKLNDNWKFLFGSEYHNIHAEDKIGNFLFAGDKDDITLSSYDVYGEVEQTNSLFTITTGVRFESPDKFDDKIVPRVALTRAFDKLHFKLLASEGYITPTYENLRLNQNALSSEGSDASPIESEKSRVYEFETGYKFSDAAYFAVSIFEATLKDTILYQFDPETFVENYENSSGEDITRGIETNLRLQNNASYLDLNYSYYENHSANSSGLEVPGHSNYRPAFPRHKVSARGSTPIAEGLKLNPSIIFYGDRYTSESLDEEGNVLSGELDPVMIANLHLAYDVKSVKGLKFDIGVNNIIGERLEYATYPINLGKTPLPGFGREYLLKLTYSF